MAYNISFTENVTNVVDLYTGVTYLTQYDFLYGNLILFGFFMLLLAVSVRVNFNEVLILDGFLSTILAIFLYRAEMIAASTIIYPAVIMMIAFVFYFITK